MASTPWAEGIEAIVLRTVNDQPTLWDSILPPELLLLPVGWMRCWTIRCSSRRSPRISMLGSGRPSIPVETYLRFRFPAAPRLKAQVREIVLSLGFSVSTPQCQQIGLRSSVIASLRTRSRKDGTTYDAVVYRHDGRQTSTSFEDLTTARRSKDLVNVVGPPSPGFRRCHQHPNRISANPPPPTTAACKIEATASCN
jgi:hypothetical protein